MRKALVINSNRNGLGVIRSLGEAGFYVITTHDAEFRFFGKNSKYSKSYYDIPPFDQSHEKFIESLVEIGKKEFQQEKIFLIPTGDMYVFICAKFWEQLSNYFIPVFDTNLETLLQCGDKIKFLTLLKSIHLPTPNEYIYKDLEDPSTLKYPIIIKPSVRENSAVWRLQICNSNEDVELVKKDIDENFADVEFVIQDFIPGGDDTLYTAGIYAHEGNLLACFTGKKIRQFPPVTGEASLAGIVKEDILIEYSRKIVKEVKYTGIAQIEFKKHDGKFYAIEMNPRSWSWNYLATYAGVNLPAIGCNAATGNYPKECVTNKIEQGYWYYSLEDIRHNLIQNKNTTIFNILKVLFSKKAFAIFSWKDPKPAFTYLWYDVLSRVFVKMFRKNG